MAKFTKGDKVKIVNTHTVWDDKLGIVLREADEEIYNESGDDLTEVLVRVAFKTEDDVKSITQRFNRGNLELVPEENINEEKKMNTVKYNTNPIWEELNDTDETPETIDESYVDVKEDFIEPYITGEDEDGKKIPGWMFVDRIAAAEGCDDVAVVQCAQKNKYKLFYIECGEYNKQIVASKEIKKENIAEDFGDYLLGTARIEEIK